LFYEPALNVYRRNRPKAEGKPEQKFEAAFGTIFKNCVHKGARRNSTFFHINKAAKKLKIIFACIKSTGLSFVGLTKHIYVVTQSL
jgi:hypothetical protein